jgi:NADPH:quinone reductase
MKAVRVSEYGGPDVLQVQEMPMPAVGRGQLLLKVSACGINPLDAWFRSGHLAPRFPRPLPYTPGADVVGTVVERGQGAETFAVGDMLMGVLPVICDGGYAEYVVADEERMIALPEGLDPIVAAAAMTPGITGVQMVEKALSLGNCERMLILGALGGVGRAAVVTALARGIAVTASVLPGREAAARALGVQTVVTADDAARPEALGDRFDVVIDLIGPDHVLPWERVIAPNGRVISAVPVPPTASERTDISFTPFAYSPDAESTRKVAKMLRGGTFTVPDVEVLGLGEIGRAHAVLPGRAAGRKFVVDPAR